MFDRTKLYLSQRPFILIASFAHWLMYAVCSCLVLALICDSNFAQGQTSQEAIFSCGNLYFNNQSGHEDIESDYQTYIEEDRGLSRTPIQLPIVVHIVHDGGPENISDNQVLTAIQHLNEAFANSGYYDQSTGVTVPITFCLATQDPTGASTSGITRSESPLTSMDMLQQDDALKAIIHWDATMYINVYVVKEICMGMNCSVAGYANLPYNHGSVTDGIVVQSRDFGSSHEDDAVIIHEMGHYLGLLHTFEGGCLNTNCLEQGDRVCDTPPDQSTFPAPCQLSQNSCFSDEDDTSANNPFRPTMLGGLGDQLDMHINYMDYGDFACYSAFSQGQSDRMLFFTNSLRSSLLSSFACNPPCPDIPTANIIETDMTINVGQALTFHGTFTNESSIYWTINNITESTTDELTYSFDTKGRYVIGFCAASDDPLCRMACDQIIVDVICSTTASYTPTPNYCVPVDTTVTFQNNSSISSVIWFLNDVNISTNEQVSITFPQSGINELILIASNQVCADTFIHFIEVGCSEACFNGLDDDNDGFTDYYDTDCCCTNENFNFICDDVCYTPTPFSYNIGVEWESVPLASAGVNHPIVGDVDNDGQVEILAVNYRNGHPYTISIMNGSTGVLEYSFPTFDTIKQQIAIADMDNDGFGEIIALSKQGHVLCYEHDGGLKYRSTEIVLPPQIESFRINHVIPSIADFDQDGFPEVYAGNKIFNGQTGALLMHDALNSKGEGNKDAGFDFLQKYLTVAVDILPVEYCQACSGLELVAGNQIYSVDLVTNELTIASEIPNRGDGFTNVVDYDQDGDLDVVVNRQDKPLQKIYAWDGQTTQLLAATSFPMPYTIGGQITGNFDTDKEVEYVVLITDSLILFDNDLSVIWKLYAEEITANNIMGFDFNNDGIHEIVLRDFDFLRIVNPIDRSILFQLPSISATTIDNVAIADVDGDGGAEIILCNQRVFQCVGVIDGPDWASARPVFNQVQFFNVNINDDLSVPIHQQQHHIVGDSCILNTFGIPMAIPPPQLNGQINIQHISCEQDSFIINFEVCNYSSGNMPNTMPLSVYCGYPTNNSTTRLNSFPIENSLDCSECVMLKTKVSKFCAGTIYILLNDDGSESLPFDPKIIFPITNIIECDYENNIDSIALLDQHILDLGYDTTICNNNSILLSAGSGYLSYHWSDGSQDSTLMVLEAGLYWVEVLDSCDHLFRDSIIINTPLSPVLDLGMDTTVCFGALVLLNAGSGFVDYEWNNRSTDSAATAYEAGLYFVVVRDSCGGEQHDSLYIYNYPATPSILPDSAQLCPDDSLILDLSSLNDRQWWPDDGILHDIDNTTIFQPDSTTLYILFATNQDACALVDSMLIVVNEQIVYDTVNLCSADSIFIENSWIYTAGDYSFIRAGQGDCDSMVNYHIVEIATYEFFDTLSLCSLDSLFIENSWIYTAGDYSFVHQNIGLCDSILNYHIMEQPLFEQFDTISICPGDTIIYQGLAFFQAGYSMINKPGMISCDSIFHLNIIYEFSYYVSDTIYLCAGDSIFLDGIWIYDDELVEIIHSSSGCDSIMETLVLFNNLSYSISPDIFIESGAVAPLNVYVDATQITSLTWLPDETVTCSTCASTSSSPAETTQFTVQFTDIFGCIYRDSLMVTVSHQNDFFIPSAFSPNNDGINDHFLIYGSPTSVSTTYDIRIFNRWGGLVFERRNLSINDTAMGWNGQQKGQDASSGVYVYEVILMTGAAKSVVNGELTLVR